ASRSTPPPRELRSLPPSTTPLRSPRGAGVPAIVGRHEKGLGRRGVALHRPPVLHDPRGAAHPAGGEGLALERHAPRASAVLRGEDRKSTRLNSSHQIISYAVFCLK